MFLYAGVYCTVRKHKNHFAPTVLAEMNKVLIDID